MQNLFAITEQILVIVIQQQSLTIHNKSSRQKSQETNHANVVVAKKLNIVNVKSKNMEEAVWVIIGAIAGGSMVYYGLYSPDMDDLNHIIENQQKELEQYKSGKL